MFIALFASVTYGAGYSTNYYDNKVCAGNARQIIRLANMDVNSEVCNSNDICIDRSATISSSSANVKCDAEAWKAAGTATYFSVAAFSDASCSTTTFTQAFLSDNKCVPDVVIPNKWIKVDCTNTAMPFQSCSDSTCTLNCVNTWASFTGSNIGQCTNSPRNNSIKFKAQCGAFLNAQSSSNKFADTGMMAIAASILLLMLQ